jgi:4-amino-4-deoxy-L-arabinose transferase-like glycosyltransferase
VSPASRPPSSRAALWAVVGLLTLGAFLLRLEYNRVTEGDNPVRADARQYVIYGFNLAHHGTFSQDAPSRLPGAKPPVPDSFRSPGYPLFLAGVFLLGDERGFLERALLAQAVVGALLVPLTCLLGLSFLPAWAAAGAAGAVAFNPHLVSIGNNLLTETLFAFCLLLALLALSAALRRGGAAPFAAAGALFGVAYLVNEIALLLPFLLAALMMGWWRRTGAKGWREAARPLAAFLAAFLLFWGGWTVRNAVSVPPGGQSGGSRALQTLTHGTYIDFIYKSPEFREFPYREDPEQPAFGASWGNFARIFGRRFAERPLRHLSWYLLEKPYWLWSWDMLQGPGDVYVYPVVKSLYLTSPAADAVREAYRVTHIPVLAVTLAGLLWAGWRWRRKDPALAPESGALPVFALLASITAIYSIFACWSRYSLPARPELYLAFFWTLAAFAAALAKKGPPAKGERR